MNGYRLLIVILGGVLWAGAQQATAPRPVEPKVPASAKVAAPEISARNTAVPQKLDFLHRGGWTGFWQRYQPANVAPPNLSNPEPLTRGAERGTLYLSLRQVLQLALAADLNIADANYAQLLARPDYLRTLAGGTARGVAGETISSALFSGAIGASGNGGGAGGGSSAGSVAGGGSGVHGGGGGYDPVVSINFADEHSRSPLANPVLYGTAVQILNQAYGGISFGQSFTTGTGYSLSFSSNRQYQNSALLFLNPQVASSVTIGVQQDLLNGGSRTVNRAGMVMGRNSLKYADAYYKLQVTDIVAQAATQYWTLVAAANKLDIARQGEQNAQQTLNDTNTLIDNGKVAAADRITAQLALSTAAQTALSAETLYRKAASKLKSFLAKQWSPAVIAARVVPTDAMPNPVAEATPAVADLVQRALLFSPQLAQDRINVDNNDLIVKIRKNTLLPTLTVYASYTSSGVSGLGLNCAVDAFPCPAGDLLAPLPGGFGASVHKIFSYGAPDYGVGVHLSIPVWNRMNRADEATAELQAAQSRVDLQKDQNVITEQVNEDRIELVGQSAQLQSARQGEKLQAESLSNARDKYRLGKGTLTDVLTAEAALVTAQTQVVEAQQAYAAAQVALAKDSGTLLDDYHISLGPASNPDSIRRAK